MKNVILILSVLAIGFTSNAQTTGIKTLKKVMELKITREGGANGASVAWHPIQKKYYAAMAGNASFQMGVFDAAGKALHKPDQEIFFDVRGLWYNPKTKTLQANGYNDFGWTEYKLDSKGMPVSVKALYDEVMYQPDEQSVGTYDPKNDVVYFFKTEDGNLAKHKMSEGYYDDDVILHLGYKNQAAMDDEFTEDNASSKSNYNPSVFYTGFKGSEIGLLNSVESKIEMYNIATGFKTKELRLPDDAPVKDFLNFSFANGIFWLFDKEARIWKGYK